MSKEETIPNSDEAKQDDKKEKERKEKKDKFKPRTKIIVRHLPPSMTEEQFISQVSPLPEGSQYYYVRPDSSLDEYAFCRAYILIPNLEDQLLFRDKFDNYIFLDSLGGLEYAAIVEYAPYQKFPSRKPVKELTEEEEKEIKESYENDPAYILFLEKKAKAEKTDPLDDLTLELTKETSSKKNVITTTPLLEFIKEKRAEKQRFKEERKKKEIERKKMVAEEKRKKAESSNYKVKSEKDGSKNFQNKNKREEDENHKSRCRDEENVKSRFRDHDKSRYPDDEAKLRHKADRREPLKHSRSFEKIPSKKQINHESKKSYEYQNPKYDQKKPHHLREYENKSYHKDYENKSYHKDYENKSKDYDHKRQYHDDKRRPKSEWKNSKDSKYKDYDSRSKDWEHQGAKPRKKLPQNPTRKEEEPKKILENKNKPENELQQDLKQEEESNNSLIEKNEETIQTDSFKDLPPVVNTESEIKNNTSTSSKSESDPITVKSLDSKSNDSDSTLKEEPINKDPRPERRIRNKDRPSLEIYRPGMGRFSRQRREQEKTNSIDQESPTNSPNHLTLNKTKGNIHTPSDYSDS